MTRQNCTSGSGVNGLVTGRLAGSAAGDYDVDGGVTSIHSPALTLPAAGSWSLSGYAGQTVRILVEAADASGASLGEAGVDDVAITQQ